MEVAADANFAGLSDGDSSKASGLGGECPSRCRFRARSADSVRFGDGILDVRCGGLGDDSKRGAVLGMDVEVGTVSASNNMLCAGSLQLSLGGEDGYGAPARLAGAAWYANALGERGVTWWTGLLSS